jgi:diguanylate cyclase (GGDEF)-like protein
MVEPPRAEQSWLLDALCLAKQYLLVFGGALALIASLTMVLLLQSQLRRFSVAIQRLTSGDWDARVAYPARDEFGYLARAFNQMAQQLQQAFEAQEQQREELLAQNEELERVHAQLQQAHQELATLNAELLEANRALAQAAVTDGLTGLKNHRAFQEALHSAAQMAERLQQPLSLVMFDIDHFKQFNDTYGHPAGDELLRQVAQVLRESARAYDVAARYGGEEFACCCPTPRWSKPSKSPSDCASKSARLRTRTRPSPRVLAWRPIGAACPPRRWSTKRTPRSTAPNAAGATACASTSPKRRRWTFQRVRVGYARTVGIRLAPPVA